MAMGFEQGQRIGRQTQGCDAAWPVNNPVVGSANQTASGAAPGPYQKMSFTP